MALNLGSAFGPITLTEDQAYAFVQRIWDGENDNMKSYHGQAMAFIKAVNGDATLPIRIVQVSGDEPQRSAQRAEDILDRMRRDEAFDRRLSRLEAVVRQLLELSVVKYSGVVTERLEGE